MEVPGRRLTLRVLLAGAVIAVAAAGPWAPSAGAAVVKGHVLTGAQPVVSMPVTLYRTASGRGGPTRLGHGRTLTNGSFRISYRGRLVPGDAVLYVLAGRGDAVRLAAALGTGRVPRRVVVNERTTVAAGYALAQFIDGRRISGRAPGPRNAVSMAANLVDVRTGRVSAVLRRKPNGVATSTWRTVNSLSNLVARCVRVERRCGRLLRLAKPPRGRAPRGTLAAVASIARNPWQNVGELFRLALAGQGPYRPALSRSQQPDAWTLALRFDGDGKTMSGPGNFAIDVEGNVFVLNNYVYEPGVRTPACASDLLLKFTPDGRYAPGSPYTGGGLSGAGYGITFDPTGNLWIGNYGFAAPGCASLPAHDSVSKFTPEGDPLSPSDGFTQGSIFWPQGTVSDRRGNIWIANCGNDTVTLYPNGDPSAARNLSGLGLEKPFDIAVNHRGEVFVTAVGSSTVARLNPDGSVAPGSPITEGGLNHPMGIAVDSRGYLWVANSGLIDLPCPTANPSFASRGGSLTLIGRDGQPVRTTAFEGGGMTIPWGIAVDGDDHVWVANFGKQRVSELCGMRPATCPPGVDSGEPISPDGTGYGFDGLARSTAVAIDPSGNVWLTNNWKTVPVQTNPGGRQIVAYVGAAAPLRTPIIGPPRR
jgi:hypothetical protein